MLDLRRQQFSFRRAFFLFGCSYGLEFLRAVLVKVCEFSCQFDYLNSDKIFACGKISLSRFKFISITNNWTPKKSCKVNLGISGEAPGAAFLFKLLST